MQLKDKVALIVGASTQGGIGAATARRFVADGAQVIVSARRQEALEAVASAVGAAAMTCDITDERQVEALIGAALGLATGSTCWSSWLADTQASRSIS